MRLIWVTVLLSLAATTGFVARPAGTWVGGECPFRSKMKQLSKTMDSWAHEPSLGYETEESAAMVRYSHVFHADPSRFAVRNIVTGKPDPTITRGRT